MAPGNGGQFQKGNPGGPGRPKRATEGAYLRALTDACPPDTWREICEAQVSAARSGDSKAAAWLCRYLMGNPAPGALADLAWIADRLATAQAFATVRLLMPTCAPTPVVCFR